MRNRRPQAAQGSESLRLLLLTLALLLLPLRSEAQEPVDAPPVPAPDVGAESVEPAPARLDKREFDLGRALDSTRLDLSSSQRRFEAAQARLDAAAEPSEALSEEVAARRLQLSSEQRAEALLEEHPKILEQPEPVVLFRDFGDNALIFEVRFWIEMRSVLDRLRIESDVRFRIDELCREASIVIAFPQRDVHLDSVSPVEVRIVEATEKPDAQET